MVMADSRRAPTDRISVCICTFKRPALLARLLDAIERQMTDGSFAFEVVVVDNDAKRSSEAVVSALSERRRIAATYDCEPE